MFARSRQRSKARIARELSPEFWIAFWFEFFAQFFRLGGAEDDEGVKFFGGAEDIYPEAGWDVMPVTELCRTAGIGPAILPRRVGAYGHERRLVRLHPSLPFMPDTICLVYRADMHRTRAAMRTKDELVAFGRSLDARPQV